MGRPVVAPLSIRAKSRNIFGLLARSTRYLASLFGLERLHYDSKLHQRHES